MFERKTYRYMRGVAVRRRRQDCASSSPPRGGGGELPISHSDI